MSNRKYTPGPWEVSESPDYFDNGAVVIRATNKCVVAVLTDLDWPVKSARESNATLISSAPELLEALEKMVGYYSGPRTFANEEIDDMARAAIAKSYGEAEFRDDMLIDEEESKP